MISNITNIYNLLQINVPLVDPEGGGCRGTAPLKIGQILAKLAHFLPILAYNFDLYAPLTDYPGSVPVSNLRIDVMLCVLSFSNAWIFSHN